MPLGTAVVCRGGQTAEAAARQARPAAVRAGVSRRRPLGRFRDKAELPSHSPPSNRPSSAVRCPLSAVRCPVYAVRCPLSTPVYAVHCPVSAVRCPVLTTPLFTDCPTSTE